MLCCCSATQSCPTLCDPMDCSTPGCPVLHYLPEFTEIYVNWVGDAIQPSHPLLPTSPLALDLSQNRWGEKVIVRLYKIIYAKLLKIVKHYRIFFFNSTQFKKRKKNEGTTYLEKPIFIDLGQSSIFTTSSGGQVPFKISWLIVLSSTSIRKVSVHFSSVAQSCPTLGDPINCSIPGLPVHHQLPESTKTHVHRVGDAIRPSNPLSSPSPPAPNPSQHQGLFQWVSSLYQVAKVLDFQLQHQSFQWTPRTHLL